MSEVAPQQSCHVEHSQVSIQVWWCKWCWRWSLACPPSLVPPQIFLVDCDRVYKKCKLDSKITWERKDFLTKIVKLPPQSSKNLYHSIQFYLFLVAYVKRYAVTRTLKVFFLWSKGSAILLKLSINTTILQTNILLWLRNLDLNLFNLWETIWKLEWQIQMLLV